VGVSRNENARELGDLLVRLADVLLIGSTAIATSLLLSDDVRELVAKGTLVAFSIVFSLILFPLFGIYRSWRGRSKLRMASYLAFAWAVAQLCALAAMFALRLTMSVSRMWWLCWVIGAVGALIVLRLTVHAVLAKLRQAGHDLREVAIVGAGRHCARLVRKIAELPDSGFRAVAILNTQTLEQSVHDDLPGYRDLATFAARVRRTDVREIWVALPMSEESMLLRILEEFKGDLVNVRFIPDVRSLAMFGGEMTDLLGAPAINLMASPISSFDLLQKAIFDWLFAAIALLALVPLLVVIAVAVKLSSQGPVLFTQRRKGVDGKVFRIYKFRTMRVQVEQAGVVRQAARKDPRVTRVGSFLRRTSLDELPQFLNVLRGEMSVVGPRPHALEHDDHYQKSVAGYIHRYRVKPGITGWAQINGFRGETDQIEKMQCRVEHDLYYMKNWSFGLDMRIVLATVTKGMVHRNAY
jgi:Undecaprenyl-phosphate glucose phosphotransferase